MRYLGRLRGVGALKSDDDKTNIRTHYDFDGYLGKQGKVTSSGEIRMSPADLSEIFGRKGLRLLTQEGRRLTLVFSEKQLRAASSTAHVDVEGDLPDAFDWHH